MLVTNESGDFAPLMEHERRHPGLICSAVAHGLISLMEIALDADWPVSRTKPSTATAAT